jgi:plasmid stabilization system protein ParE
VASISFHPAAQGDLQDALDWYSARSLQAANRFEAAVDAALALIANNPLMYGLLDDRHRACSVRRFPYTVIYREDSGNVTIVAVAHTRRSAAFWQGRS